MERLTKDPRGNFFLLFSASVNLLKLKGNFEGHSSCCSTSDRVLLLELLVVLRLNIHELVPSLDVVLLDLLDLFPMLLARSSGEHETSEHGVAKRAI